VEQFQFGQIAQGDEAGADTPFPLLGGLAQEDTRQSDAGLTNSVRVACPAPVFQRGASVS
jgi:hypothetical protein